MIEKDVLVKLAKNHTIKQIATKLNISYNTIWYALRKYEIDAAKDIKKIVAFDNFTFESCYWAGYIGAAGNIRDKGGTYIIRLDCDKKHLEKFKNFTGLETSNIYSKYAVKQIKNNFNIIPNKTFNLLPPYKIPKHLISHYVRGYFDGKGHIGYGGGVFCNFNIVSTSKILLEWIAEQIETTKIYKKKNSFYIDINNKLNFKILNWIYSNSTEHTRLNKKYNDYLKILKDIENKKQHYNDIGKRVPSGCKGFKLNYKKISQEYLEGKTLNFLANKYTVSIWTLLDNFKKIGIRKGVKRHLNSKVFDDYNKESCYWAGFLAADGWVQKYNVSCELSQKDEKHLIKLKNFCNSNASIVKRTRNEHFYTAIHFNSKELANGLINNFKVVPKKSLILEPPNLPEELIKHYIRGYFDGDGSIGWHKHNDKPRAVFCSGCFNFLEWIKQILKTNIKEIGEPSVVRRENSNTCIISFMGKQVLKIFDWIYENSNETIRLDRKYERYLKYKKIISNKRKQEIENLNYLKSLYLSGMTVKDIANFIGKNYSYVRYNLNKLNLVSHNSKMDGEYGKKIKTRDVKILNDYVNGISILELSNKYGLAKSTIWAAIKRTKNDVSQKW